MQVRGQCDQVNNDVIYGRHGGRRSLVLSVLSVPLLAWRHDYRWRRMSLLTPRCLRRSSCRSSSSSSGSICRRCPVNDAVNEMPFVVACLLGCSRESGMARCTPVRTRSGQRMVTRSLGLYTELSVWTTARSGRWSSAIGQRSVTGHNDRHKPTETNEHGPRASHVTDHKRTNTIPHVCCAHLRCSSWVVQTYRYALVRFYRATLCIAPF